MQATILLSDAETNLSVVLGEYLEDKGYRVLRVSEPKEVLPTLRQEQVDLLLLDIANPGGNGFSLIRQIRTAEYKLPILVVSERCDRTDILRAYELGADDYVQKPYSMEVLVAKIRVWIQRTGEEEESKRMVVELGGKTLDGRKSTLGGEYIGPRKTMILLMLARREGEMVDRHKILRDVWGKDDAFVSRSLSVYITDLRKRVEALGYQISTMPGKGYALVKR